ncbi:unnamed protein product [Rotaria sordida]|uniref:Uncharacterized protein n=2 Tax=Rotaria sordida TaxID=392033 RepID=A0A819NHU5_9BILA|nr:unnamed protein product [Rotaria sordida]
MFKLFIIAVVCFTIVNGNVKDDLKDKITDTLGQGGKVKQHVVNVVNERTNKAKDAAHSAADAIKDNADTVKDKASETLKAGQKAAGNAKATADKKLDETKKAGKELKKKASGSVEDLKDTSSHSVKSAKKKAENVAEKASKKGEKIKRQVSDTGEKIKRQASDAEEKVKTNTEDAKKQVEKQSDGIVDKLFNILIDVKNSLLEPVGLASNTATDIADQATSKLDEVSDTLNNCDSRSIKCSFCQEPQPSSSALSAHLMLCGNKTDQCPNCRKFIRRAIFAYHYENNCANLEETDTPIPQSRNSSAHRRSSKSNRSVSQQNDVNDHNQEDDSSYISSNCRSKPLDEVSSSASNKRSTSDTIISKSSNNQYLSNDHKVHQENRLENQIKMNEQLEQTSQISNTAESRSSANRHRKSQDIVYIPCEICNKQVDLRYWATHVQDCREREIRRIEALAETINRKPFTEKLPCEYCEELLSIEQLQTHERFCRKNPDSMARTAKLNNSQPFSTVAFTNRSLKIDRDPTLLSTYHYSSLSKDIRDRINDRERTTTLENGRASSHVSINVRRTNETMKQHDNNISPLAINGQPTSRQRKTTSDVGLQLINSSRDVPAHDTFLGLQMDHRSSGTQSLPNRSHSAISLERKTEHRRPMPRLTGSASVDPSRGRSTSKTLLDERGSTRSNGTKVSHHFRDNDNNNVLFHSPRIEDQQHRPQLNQSGRPETLNKKFKWKPPLQQPPMKF